MQEIELSIMIHTPQTVEIMRGLLDEFERQSGIHVNLTTLQWNSAHADLNRTALYHHGPDVSEIGSTWVSDLIAMNALRPFSMQEIYSFGRPEEFAAESWKTGHLINDDTQWAIPWLAETYVIHYRWDLLQRAGVDESTAFQSHAALAETVRCLQAAGIETPIEFPVNLDRFGNLHVLASWVWTSGGDFCSPDGKSVRFTEPEAMNAIRAYFDLFRLLSPASRKMVSERQSGLFQQGKAAISFGTLVFGREREQAPQIVRENWCAVPLPGAHFIGGSNLVVWKHAHSDRAALDLVRFLTSQAVQARCALPQAALPPRLSALATPHIAQDPMTNVMAQSIRSGRSYYAIPLWGLVEDRLVQALMQIARCAIAEENVDLDALIHQYIHPMARKLSITLSQ